MQLLKGILGVLVALAWVGSAPAVADTVNYTYDALGRLIQVQYVGGPNDGRVIIYHYDAAGNRTAVVRN